jgi:glutamate synthase (NADPH/NADH) small chain
VTLRLWSRPRKLLVSSGRVCGVEFESTQTAGETHVLEADMVFMAIGQKVVWDRLADTAQILDLKQDRILVDEERRTSLSGVWAGGDCVFGGEDLTVSAVQDGKLAALSIDRFLRR